MVPEKDSNVSPMCNVDHSLLKWYFNIIVNVCCNISSKNVLD